MGMDVLRVGSYVRDINRAWEIAFSPESNFQSQGTTRRNEFEQLLRPAILSYDWDQTRQIAMAFQRSGTASGEEINTHIATTLLENFDSLLYYELRNRQTEWSNAVGALVERRNLLEKESGIAADKKKQKLTDQINSFGPRPREITETNFGGLLLNPVSVSSMRRNMDTKAGGSLSFAAACLAESFTGGAEDNFTCAVLCEPLRASAAMARFMRDQDEHLDEQIRTGKAGSQFTDSDLAFWQTSDSNRVASEVTAEPQTDVDPKNDGLASKLLSPPIKLLEFDPAATVAFVIDTGMGNRLAG